MAAGLVPVLALGFVVGLAFFPKFDGGVILLRRSGRAAAVGNVFFQKLRQLRHDFRMRGACIRAFADILGQVVELDRRELFRCLAAGLRRAPTAGTGAKLQLPLALADGEGAVDGM